MTLRLAFRPMQQTDADKRFVLGSWLDATRHCYSSGLCPMERWYDWTWPIYEAVTARPDMRTVIAHEHGDETGFIGFIIADPTPQRVPGKEPGQFRMWPSMVVFVYVKAPYRKRGYARRLFEAAGIDTTRPFLYAGDTPTGKKLASKVPLAKWNTLPVRYPKEKT